MPTGEPTGANLASVNFDPFDLAANIQWTNFVLNDSVEINEGQEYAIIASTTGAVLADALEWGQVLADLYDGGSKWISSDSGSSWTESSTRDCLFRTYAGETLKDSFETGYDPYMAKQYVHDPYHVAQVFTAGSSYTLTKVSLAISKGDGTPGYDVATIAIKNTANEPAKPTNPTPTNEASDVTLDATSVTWEDGGSGAAAAVSYNIYQGTLSGFLSLVEEGIINLSYALRSTNWPNYGQARYWRVDAVNDYGTTTGDEWYFTTLVFYPPTPSGVTWSDPGNGTGYTGTPTGLNNMLTCRRLVAVAANAVWYET